MVHFTLSIVQSDRVIQYDMVEASFYYLNYIQTGAQLPLFHSPIIVQMVLPPNTEMLTQAIH